MHIVFVLFGMFYLLWVLGIVALGLVALTAFGYFLGFIYKLFSGEYDEDQQSEAEVTLDTSIAERQRKIAHLETRIRGLENE